MRKMLDGNQVVEGGIGGIRIWYFCCLVTKSCLILLWSYEPQCASLSCTWDSPGKNTRVSCHFLLLETFPTQGLNLCLQDCRRIIYHWAIWKDHGFDKVLYINQALLLRIHWEYFTVGTPLLLEAQGTFLNPSLSEHGRVYGRKAHRFMRISLRLGPPGVSHSQAGPHSASKNT